MKIYCFSRVCQILTSTALHAGIVPLRQLMAKAAEKKQIKISYS